MPEAKKQLKYSWQNTTKLARKLKLIPKEAENSKGYDFEN